MLRLSMDHHVPGPITVGLRQRGVDVLTAEEDGTTQLDDNLLLDRASAMGRILVSQDKDLLAIAHDWHQTGTPFAGLAYAHQWKISIGQAIHDLELLVNVLTDDYIMNRVEYLPYS